MFIGDVFEAKVWCAGGHAAHFANIDQGSPMFSQERAPTSVAYAENQSMFLDSFIGDAAWKGRYALTRSASGTLWPSLHVVVASALLNALHVLNISGRILYWRKTMSIRVGCVCMSRCDMLECGKEGKRCANRLCTSYTAHMLQSMSAPHASQITHTAMWLDCIISSSNQQGGIGRARQCPGTSSREP